MNTKLVFNFQNNEKYINILAVSFLFTTYIGNGINWTLLNAFNIPFSYFNIIWNAFLGILLFMSFPIIKNRIKLDMIFLFFLFILLYLISMFSEATYFQIFRQGLLTKTFLLSIPMYVFIRIVTDYTYFFKVLFVFSIITLTLHILAFTMYDVGSRENYLTFSNGLIASTPVFLIKGIMEKKRSYLVLFGAGSLLMFIAGRRSSLIALIGCFIILCLYKRAFKPIIYVLIISIPLLYYIDDILKYLYYIANNFGVRPRIINKFLNNSISDDSHRFDQWSYALKLVFSSWKNIIFGLGIAGERNYLLQYFPHMVLRGYPHNITVELISHFGIIVGTAINVFLMSSPIKFLKKKLENSERTYLLIYFLTLFITLQFQDSYLQSKFFFAYLGILVSFYLVKE